MHRYRQVAYRRDQPVTPVDDGSLTSCVGFCLRTELHAKSASHPVHGGGARVQSCTIANLGKKKKGKKKKKIGPGWCSQGCVRNLRVNSHSLCAPLLERPGGHVCDHGVYGHGAHLHDSVLAGRGARVGAGVGCGRRGRAACRDGQRRRQGRRDRRSGRCVYILMRGGWGLGRTSAHHPPPPPSPRSGGVPRRSPLVLAVALPSRGRTLTSGATRTEPLAATCRCALRPRRL